MLGTFFSFPLLQRLPSHQKLLKIHFSKVAREMKFRHSPQTASQTSLGNTEDLEMVTIGIITGTRKEGKETIISFIPGLS